MDFRYLKKLNSDTPFEEDPDLTVIGPDSTSYEGKELAPVEEHLKVVDGKAGESYGFLTRIRVSHSL